MNSATRGIDLMIEPVDTELTRTELVELELAEIELVGGLGGGAAACAPPQSEQWL